jgi:effector-binding domain-containing protein
MLETPELAQSAAQLTACIRLNVPRAEIRNVMGPGIRETLAAVASQGVGPIGPWFTHHFQRPNENFDFEICVPVKAPLAPVGRVHPGELRAAKVVRALYHGPYEGLAGAWGELEAWVKAHGHTPAEDFWERYLVGPESSANPADWRTELNRPLV